MDWDILPRRDAWWPRCGSPMLCSDGPPLLDVCRWLSLVRFPVVACVEPWVRLSFVEPTSPVAGASSSRPSYCLPNVLLLAASGCTISSVAVSIDSSRNGVPSVTFKTSQDYKGAVKEKMLWIHSGRGELPTMYQG
ncbi:uncharacterized protein [Aegilops tauschii subsp. strangulata]|uniref:Uncharacterized protein n=1 Tax=Aegilops tauschii subsp. strangulata TaxID=200361 RepID=A0A453HVZ8_AEGTS|nr:uncharacterized protein LOC109782822 isoform X3 [Aegilops tauschii subsp. strangulata]